jgi:hypothetical protein
MIVSLATSVVGKKVKVQNIKQPSPTCFVLNWKTIITIKRPKIFSEKSSNHCTSSHPHVVGD